MGFRKVLAICPFSFEQIGYSVQAKTVNTHIAPEINYFKNFVLYPGIVIIEIRLVVKEAMPVILLCRLIPCPVAALKILENNSHIFIFRRVIAPNIVISFF